MSQPSLWDQPATVGAAFDGETVDGELDGARLERLLDRVRDYMLGQDFETLAAIRAACGGTEASVSARLRDLRKARFGGYTVERRRVPGLDPHAGLWEYRVRPARGRSS